ncbi:hypothetical protein P8631_12455, partial [Guyparkeria sp. 1SP6A2]|nr:hypothetical protein [Guyparkeria sp. 1SP6A2]
TVNKILVYSLAPLNRCKKFKSIFPINTSHEIAPLMQRLQQYKSSYKPNRAESGTKIQSSTKIQRVRLDLNQSWQIAEKYVYKTNRFQ